ncbi:ATP-dependent helicase HrpB [Paenibacillus chartarius]|uniref:ATP-dependent helicase HrpB n=1 Tax=Paenibacillus chartarius TaxID=747481 RepID=A0ABV6DSQ2_9BACL
MTGVTLPIDEVLPELRQCLREQTGAVLVAEPGAGKTTRVPLALLEEDWLQGKRVVMLEPRRLAARSAAAYMARSLGEPVGAAVGYRVRGETKVSAATRIEVITEGVLTRMLQSDPSLDGIGAVIFDEFHERSLQADLGLALCLQAQSLIREDLRLLVMSATLDAEPVSGLMGGVPVVRSRGRTYPVEMRYRPVQTAAVTAAQHPLGRGIEQAVAAVVLEALRDETEGDVLVFLPGAGEIRRTEALLGQALSAGSAPGGGRVRLAALYGAMPQEAQDRALQPAADGTRKVVLATAIAETSLTVEGVRIVVDSGLARVSRFSPRSGMTRLETVPVPLSSADQRRGRAGRLGPGVCYRLWSEEEERRLPAHGKPEVLEADLSSLALELAVWGVRDPAELAWLTPPPAAAYEQARELLAELGALDAAGTVTAHGRRMAELGAAPRLAHMLLRGAELGRGALACELAALLGERDLLRGAPGGADADMRLRVEALHALAAGADARTAGADPAAASRAAAEAGAWRRMLGIPAGARGIPDEAGMLLAFAYPDRVGQARGGGKFLLSGGRGAALGGDQRLAAAPYIVAADVDDGGTESRIWLAAPVSLPELERAMPDRIVQEASFEWDGERQQVLARIKRKLGVLTLKEAIWDKPPEDELRAALLSGIRSAGLTILPWSKASEQLKERIGFLHRNDPDSWPDMSEEGLLAALDDWLGPHVGGMRGRSDLQRLSMTAVLEAGLSWEQRSRLEREAPTHITVPSGSRIPVDYGDPEQPTLAVRLQEVFGWTETPRIAGGRVPLTLHLLSPAQRPVQVTKDLASFWRSTYFEVKKDLKGRYPKHYWPDDPLQATPTNRAKPRS